MFVINAELSALREACICLQPLYSLHGIIVCSCNKDMQDQQGGTACRSAPMCNGGGNGMCEFTYVLQQRRGSARGGSLQYEHLRHVSCT